MDLITNSLNNIDQDEDIENSRFVDNNDYIETYKPDFFDNKHEQSFEPDSCMESDECICIFCTSFVFCICIGVILVINLI